MKRLFNIKTFIVLLIAIFVFSVVNLYNVFAAEKIITLTGVNVIDKSTSVSTGSIDFDDETITNDATFHVLDDFITYELTFKNNSDKTIKVKKLNITNPDEYITYDFLEDIDKTVDPDDEFSIEITAKYAKEETNLSNRSKDLQTKFNLLFDDGNENTTSFSINNPNTNDKLIIYLSLFIVSGGLLVVVISRNRKVNKKIISVLVLAFVITPILGFALDTNSDLEFVSNYNLQSKLSVKYMVNNEVVEEAVDYNSDVTPDDASKDGFDFIGWVDAETNEDIDLTNIKNDIVIKPKFRVINYTITCDFGDATGECPETYNIETGATIPNASLQGYNFDGWSVNGSTTYQKDIVIDAGITGDMNYVAHFTPRDDTTYYIIHKQQNIDNDEYVTVETETLHGTTGETVTAPTKSYTGFQEVDAGTVYIKPDGTGEKVYQYNRTTHRLTYSNVDTSASTAAGTYRHGKSITLKAKNRTSSGYEFTSWSTGQTTETITFDLTKDFLNVRPNYQLMSYTVSFVSNGGSSVDSQTVYHGYGVSSIPVSTYEGKAFDGWYDSNNHKLTLDTKITSNVVYSARWVDYEYRAVSQKTAGTLTTGDEICYGGECFLVLSSNSTTTTLFAKYNVDVSGNGLQLTDLDGDYIPLLRTKYFVSDQSLNSDYKYPRYYYDGIRIVNGNAPNGVSWKFNDIYDEDLDGAPGTDTYSIAYYLKQYKNTLNGLGMDVSKVRMITLKDMWDQGLIYWPSGFDAPDSIFVSAKGEQFLTSPIFIGTVLRQNIIYMDVYDGMEQEKEWNNEGRYSLSFNDANCYASVRPIIEVSTQDILTALS